MTITPARPQFLDFFGTPLVIEPSPGQIFSDAGLVPVRQFDHRIGLTRAFADALDVSRNPDLIEHTRRRWSAPASTASLQATRTRTAMTPSAPTPSSISSPTTPRRTRSRGWAGPGLPADDDGEGRLMRLLKLKDVAVVLTCSLSNVYARVQDGSLPVVRVGKSKGFRVLEDDLQAHLAERRSEALAAPAEPLKHITLR